MNYTQNKSSTKNKKREAPCKQKGYKTKVNNSSQSFFHSPPPPPPPPSFTLTQQCLLYSWWLPNLPLSKSLTLLGDHGLHHLRRAQLSRVSLPSGIRFSSLNFPPPCSFFNCEFSAHAFFMFFSLCLFIFLWGQC